MLKCKFIGGSEQGDALVQLVVALPLLTILVFLGIRYGIAAGASPHIESNLLAVLQSTKEPTYDAAVTTIVPNLSSVTTNVADFVARFPAGTGPTKASSMLGLANTAHGMGFSAFNCPCEAPCPMSALISTSQFDPESRLDPAWTTRVQTSCSRLSENLPRSECAQTATFVCYGAQVTFSLLSRTQTVGAVFPERFTAQQRIRTRSALSYQGAVTYSSGP